MPYSDDVELLRRLYDRFNVRDMEAVLATMHNEVIWANGMEGGHVHGRDGVRDYWTRQWALIDPRVEPLNFGAGPDGEVVVEVHQTVRDLEGNVLVDQMVGHIFRLEHGVIRRFDIRESPS
jgi:ketosteroid isomerase-like protein